jgi:putative heme-binding domain-containing protein
MLAAVVAKKIPTAAINANQIRRIRDFSDPEITQTVVSIWGQIRDGRNPDRERVVRRYLELVSHGPRGNPQAGAKVYERLCAQCHQFKGKGMSVGPSLNENGRTGLPLLVSNILDPNLVIGKDYQARTAVLDDGRVISGLIMEDSPTRVVLKLAGDKLETIPRDRLESLKISDVSLMPDAQEKQMTDTEFRDLVAFLVN